MFRSLLAAAAIYASMLSTSNAAPDNPFKGEVLLGDCKLAQNEVFGYRAGVCQGIVHSIHMFRNVGWKSCVPAQVTHGQRIRVIVAYLENNPARLHEDGVILAVDALMAAWPCK